MSEAVHTPTPWTLDEVRTSIGRAFRMGSGEMLTAGKGCCIIYDDHGRGNNERKANAEFIVRAVNAHDDLVNASHAKDYTITTLRLQRADLIKAGAAFYAAYEKLGDDIPDSDLDNEQPKHITVTLGDIRRMRRALAKATPQKEHA